MDVRPCCPAGVESGSLSGTTRYCLCAVRSTIRLEIRMSSKSLMFDERQVMTESGEDAFRRIAARKLREWGCQKSEMPSAVERLLAKPMGIGGKDSDETVNWT